MQRNRKEQRGTLESELVISFLLIYVGDRGVKAHHFGRHLQKQESGLKHTWPMVARDRCGVKAKEAS